MAVDFACALPEERDLIDMNLEFKKLTLEDIVMMRHYFEHSKLHPSDYSATFKYMWQDHFTIDFAYVENCVVFREFYQGRTYFHYPLELEDGSANKALDALEFYARENNIRIHFTIVPREKIIEFVDRYGMEMRITNHRVWRDYLYDAQDFISYAGKKFAGQRNHVNKFKKLYTDYEFIALTGNDRELIARFLKRFEKRQLEKGTVMAKEELEGVYGLLPHIDALGLLVGALKVDGEVIALSMGERCGDQLIIHVEKALTEFEGAYPTMAQEFARHFVDESIRFINREDDAGDAGLRKSKLQYNPVELVDKYDVFPRRVIDKMTHIPVIATERLMLREIDDRHSREFFRLEYDEDRNRYWGYNWREHFSADACPTPEYFMQGIREDFKNREEVPMGIFCGNSLVGEVVLHNFGYRNDCEVGVRLLPEYEGRGYAGEAVKAVIGFALFDLNIDVVYAKCYKQNERSKKMLLSVGLRQCDEDERYYYFRKTAAM